MTAENPQQRISIGMAQKYSFGNAGVQVQVQYYGGDTGYPYEVGAIRPQARHVYATVIGAKR
jgi:hypothetical protein